jgi:hypothetical protein
VSTTHLSDTPHAPKLVPHFAPAEIVDILTAHGGEIFQVVIESPDDGSTSHLVGPFAAEDAAQVWADGFIQRHQYDADFVRVSPLWELTAPDSPEIDEFYG